MSYIRRVRVVPRKSARGSLSRVGTQKGVEAQGLHFTSDSVAARGPHLSFIIEGTSYGHEYVDDRPRVGLDNDDLYEDYGQGIEGSPYPDAIEFPRLTSVGRDGGRYTIEA